MHVLFAALALDALFSATTLSGAHTGALVIDAQTNSVLYSRNADAAFIPASTMKLVVGSAALDALGDAFSFTTTLATDGSSLYVRGGGDPLLSQRDCNESAAAIRALGVTSFSGGIIGDAGRYSGARYPDGWQVDDLAYDYAAPVSALSFEENAVHVTIAPGATIGDVTTAANQPQSSAIHIVNRATTGDDRSSDSSALDLAWEAPLTLAVTGSVPAHARDPITLDAAMLDPAQVTLQIFERTLAGNGITFGNPDARTGAIPPGARVLWEHHSPALPELLDDMWKPSNNLLAETLLEELGVASPGDGDTRERGIERERAWLRSIGVDPASLTISDGSGMSAYDRVTPRALVAILAHDWAGANRPVVLSALPVSGKSGTLAHAFAHAPLAGAVIAKTGTSNHTRTLAGYVQTPRGTRIFALMVNDWMDAAPGAADRLRAVQEQFLERIRDDAGGVQ